MKAQLTQELSENGLVPDAIIRRGIRQLLRERLDALQVLDIERVALNQATLLRQMREARIAEMPHKANAQHYELPPAFFEYALGPRLKYSCAYWPDGVGDLHQAEVAALTLTCQRARVEDGMRILDLGAGWGSLSLWIAQHYPRCQVTAVSNSVSQAGYVRQQAERLGATNVTAITADMNDFQAPRHYDRIVSVEMFEHLRNWPLLFQRIGRWLVPDGEFFMHIFVHRCAPYLFEDRDHSDWMSRHFFSGGMMPSADLPLFFQDDLRLEQRWSWSGRHYERTCNAWLSNIDRRKGAAWPLLERTYGRDLAKVWWMRWRMFFMACAELFGYDNGREWFVGHYRFGNRP